MPRVADPEGTQLAGIRSLVSFAGKRVLEIGCGDGRLTSGFAGEAASVHASDPDGDEVAKAIGSLPAGLRDRVTFQVAPASDLDVPRSSIDLVFFSWSL